MTIHAIPAEIFAALLMNIEGSIHPASPFRFLLEEGEGHDLQPHVEWLESQGYLDSEAAQEGEVALLAELYRSLEIAARPIRRVTVSEVNPAETRRAVYVSDGVDVVVAMFDQQNCIVSDPADLESFHTGMVEAVGIRADGSREPLQLHPAALTLFGALVGPTGEGDEGSLAGAQGPGQVDWPLERTAVQARLAELLEEEQLAENLVEALLGDEILAADDGRIDIHQDFRPWHQALSSGHILEVQRVEFPQGQLDGAGLPIQAYFFGPSGERVLMWPAADDSGEILLTTPTDEELRGVMGYLVGFAEQ